MDIFLLVFFSGDVLAQTYEGDMLLDEKDRIIQHKFVRAEGTKNTAKSTKNNTPQPRPTLGPTRLVTYALSLSPASAKPENVRTTGIPTENITQKPSPAPTDDINYIQKTPANHTTLNPPSAINTVKPGYGVSTATSFENNLTSTSISSTTKQSEVKSTPKPVGDVSPHPTQFVKYSVQPTSSSRQHTLRKTPHPSKHIINFISRLGDSKKPTDELKSIYGRKNSLSPTVATTVEHQTNRSTIGATKADKPDDNGESNVRDINITPTVNIGNDQTNKRILNTGEHYVFPGIHPTKADRNNLHNDNGIEPLIKRQKSTRTSTSTKARTRPQDKVTPFGRKLWVSRIIPYEIDHNGTNRYPQGK